jgi:hypothetical protein
MSMNFNRAVALISTANLRDLGERKGTSAFILL